MIATSYPFDAALVPEALGANGDNGPVNGQSLIRHFPLTKTETKLSLRFLIFRFRGSGVGGSPCALLPSLRWGSSESYER